MNAEGMYCNSIDRHLDTVLSWQRASVNRWSLDKIQGATDRQSIKRRNSFVIGPLPFAPLSDARHFCRSFSLARTVTQKKKKKQEKKTVTIVKFEVEIVVEETFFLLYFSLFWWIFRFLSNRNRDRNRSFRSKLLLTIRRAKKKIYGDERHLLK